MILRFQEIVTYFKRFRLLSWSLFGDQTSISLSILIHLCRDTTSKCLIILINGWCDEQKSVLWKISFRKKNAEELRLLYKKEITTISLEVNLLLQKLITTYGSAIIIQCPLFYMMIINNYDNNNSFVVAQVESTGRLSNKAHTIFFKFALTDKYQDVTS